MEQLRRLGNDLKGKEADDFKAISTIHMLYDELAHKYHDELRKVWDEYKIVLSEFRHVAGEKLCAGWLHILLAGEKPA